MSPLSPTHPLFPALSWLPLHPQNSLPHLRQGQKPVFWKEGGSVVKSQMAGAWVPALWPEPNWCQTFPTLISLIYHRRIVFSRIKSVLHVGNWQSVKHTYNSVKHLRADNVWAVFLYKVPCRFFSHPTWPTAASDTMDFSLLPKRTPLLDCRVAGSPGSPSSLLPSAGLHHIVLFRVVFSL